MARTLAENRLLVKDYVTCLDFTAASNHYATLLSLTEGGAADATHSFTCWVKFKNISDGMNAFTFENGNASTAVSLGIKDTNKITVWKSGGSTLVNSNITAQINTWYHVGYTFDGTTNTVYVNGASANTSTTAPNTDTFIKLILANWSGLSDTFFNGYLDDFKYYPGRLLTADEILNIYNGAGITEANLKIHWKFDEGSGTSLTDSSGTGNTGTLENGVGYSTDVFSTSRTLAGSRTLSGSRTLV